MMELCKALEELHVELEELPLEQHRARDELPLLQQWPRGRADDRVTLSADLEMMDLLTRATPPPTLSAAELRRLRNDFEDFFGTGRPQLIRSAEIALHLLTSWDLLVVDKPAGARSRSDKSTEQVLAETTRSCPHDVRAIILLALPSRLDPCHARHLGLHWESRDLAFGFSAVRREADTLQLGAICARHAASGGHLCGRGTSALPRGTHHTS